MKKCRVLSGLPLGRVAEFVLESSDPRDFLNVISPHERCLKCRGGMRSLQEALQEDDFECVAQAVGEYIPLGVKIRQVAVPVDGEIDAGALSVSGYARVVVLTEDQGFWSVAQPGNYDAYAVVEYGRKGARKIMLTFRTPVDGEKAYYAWLFVSEYLTSHGLV